MRRAQGQFVSTAITLLQFPMVANPVPKLLPFPGEGYNVSGEIYVVPARGVRGYLDALEGHPHWYTRTPITVLVKGVAQEVEAYILNRSCVPPNWQDFRLLSSF